MNYNKSDVASSTTGDDSLLVSMRRISWGAVFGGTFFALGILMVMAILGIAIGISTINPWNDQNPQGLAVGQVIWWFISGIVALFFGGWATGVFSGLTRILHGALNGLVTWGLVSVILLFFAASAVGALITGGLGLLQTGASFAGQAVGAVAPALGQAAGNSEAVQSAIGQVQQSFANISQADRQTLTTIVGRTITSGKLSDTDRKTLTDMVARSANMTPQQADSAVNVISGKLQEASEAASEGVKEAAAKTAKAAAMVAWAVFIMLILDGVAAAIGGAVGIRYWDRGMEAQVRR